MSDVITLTTLKNNNIKNALNKLKENGFFLNTQERNIYIDKLDNETRSALVYIVKEFEEFDDDIKAGLFLELLKELGIKSSILYFLEDKVIEKDFTVDLLKKKLDESEYNNIEKENDLKERERLEVERQLRYESIIEQIKINKSTIKRNKDPAIRHEQLLKALK